MPSKRDESAAKVAVVEKCSFMVRRIAELLVPGETSRKGQLNAVARATGLPPRRLKDYWHGYLATVPAHQEQTIRHAYGEALRLWKERALRQIELLEAEHEENTRVVADYFDRRRERDGGAGHRAGEVGKTPTPAASS